MMTMMIISFKVVLVTPQKFSFTGPSFHGPKPETECGSNQLSHGPLTPETRVSYYLEFDIVHPGAQ